MPLDPDLVSQIAPTGTLRATINLGNPVLTSGTPDEPGGVTVAIAREIASRLAVPLELICVDAARKSFAALSEGRADLTFLAIEPARETEVRFSRPYLTIEGVYVTESDTPYRDAHEVDRPGVRIGVKQGSAYELYLTRTLSAAEVVRGTDGIDAYLTEDLDVAAGIRQPMSAFVANSDSHRLLEPAFMQIQQSVGLPRARSDRAASYVDDVVRDLLKTGFIRTQLEAAGQDPGLANDNSAEPGSPRP
ncbi:transporter substrate-binding domain-containing protein [Nocardioides sp. BGMRC 2183]|nr:transporter substrate-binding domain-containing protein [Nocardioides sp. BGMRC 2183]